MAKDPSEHKKRGPKPKLRDAKGRMLPGCTINPSGRPKTAKLTNKDKKELAALIDGRDVQKLLGFLCERADTTTEAFKYIKEFAPYLAPKLQTINSISKSDNTITIEWKSEIIKKVEDIDAEYEKLTESSKPETVYVEDKSNDSVLV